MHTERTPSKARTLAVAAKTMSNKPSRKAATVAEPAWNELANFVLTFESLGLPDGLREHRITAHKMQDGGLTAEWRGTAPQAMYDWIGQHLGDWPAISGATQAAALATPDTTSAATNAPTNAPTAAPTNAAAGAAAPAAGHREALPAFHLQVTALHPRGEAGARVNTVRAQAFDIEAHVTAESLREDDDPADPVTCEVTFFCRNTVTAEKFGLGAPVVFDVSHAQREHTALLEQVCLAPGSYRLACIARLRGAAAPVACGQGPLLQVG